MSLPAVPWSGRDLPLALAVAAFLALPAPAPAAGFDFTDQGGRAAGMAGAFAAQADDPTALYYNPGGLALLQKKKGAAAGLATHAFNEALFQGLPPGEGAGTAGEQETPLALTPHAYLLLPLGERGVFGLGAYSPYLMANEWSGKDDFSGRFLALRSELTSYDLNPTVAYALTPNLGVGLGVTYRTSEISWLRRVGRVNPLSGRFVDVASKEMTTDFEYGFGWNVGLLHRVGERFSYGLAYRSPVETDYVGVGRLTQIPTGDEQFDVLVAASLPFDQDLQITSTLEFPEVGTVGIALGLTEALLLEVDVDWTGWSRVQALPFTFVTEPDLDENVPLAFDDAMSYRLGLLWKTATGTEFRAGYAFEESPQPDETVGPFLADSDRNVFAAGFGKDWLGIAFVWHTWEQRITATSVDDFNGNWRANAWRFVLTLKK